MGVDDSSFRTNLGKLRSLIEKKAHDAAHHVATEILRLSQFEVPHDTGLLQNSGHIEPGSKSNEAIVGYNKVYAARLHEHPEFNFQKGRKGKYLEDPIKRNLRILKSFMIDSVKL